VPVDSSGNAIPCSSTIERIELVGHATSMTERVGTALLAEMVSFLEA
jgi:hypothetical protein